MKACRIMILVGIIFTLLLSGYSAASAKEIHEPLMTIAPDFLAGVEGKWRESVSAHFSVHEADPFTIQSDETFTVTVEIGNLWWWAFTDWRMESWGFDCTMIPDDDEGNPYRAIWSCAPKLDAATDLYAVYVEGLLTQCYSPEGYVEVSVQIKDETFSDTSQCNWPHNSPVVDTPEKVVTITGAPAEVEATTLFFEGYTKWYFVDNLGDYRMEGSSDNSVTETYYYPAAGVYTVTVETETDLPWLNYPIWGESTTRIVVQEPVLAETLICTEGLVSCTDSDSEVQAGNVVTVAVALVNTNPYPVDVEIEFPLSQWRESFGFLESGIAGNDNGYGTVENNNLIWIVTVPPNTVLEPVTVWVSGSFIWDQNFGISLYQGIVTTQLDPVFAERTNNCHLVQNTPLFTIVYGDVQTAYGPARAGSVVEIYDEDTKILVGCGKVIDGGFLQATLLYGADDLGTPGMQPEGQFVFKVEGKIAKTFNPFLWRNDWNLHYVKLFVSPGLYLPVVSK